MGFSERCAAYIGSNSNVATSASNFSLHDHYCVLSSYRSLDMYCYLRIFDLKSQQPPSMRNVGDQTYTTIENVCYTMKGSPSLKSRETMRSMFRSFLSTEK